MPSTSSADPGLHRRQRLLTATVSALAVLTAVAVLLLHPWGGVPELPEEGFAANPTGEELVRGEITAVRELADGEAAEFLLPGARDLVVEVRLADGRDIVLEAVDETGRYDVGQAVEVARLTGPEGTPRYAIVDLPRDAPIAGLLVLLTVAVVALGRWQGVRALVGLGASALLVVGFMIPALLSGRDATLVALVAATAVMFTTLPLSHGWSMTTRAAAAGTTIALAITIGLAVLAVEVTNLTGLASEDVQLVRFAVGEAVDVRGLLLAGFIVGTLGVLDDVTVAQASTVAALRRANPAAPSAQIFGEALRVGRDHIAATVNTLFLAYAGAALPLLILFSVGGAPFGETLTSEVVAQEVVRTVVGSVGLVLAVPLTTAIAAATVDAASPDLHHHAPALAPGAPASGPPTQAAATPPPTSAAEDPQMAEGWEATLRARYALDRDRTRDHDRDRDRADPEGEG